MNKEKQTVKLADELVKDLLNIKDTADGKVSLFSCQGQSMSGYDELANYRRLLENYRRNEGK